MLQGTKLYSILFLKCPKCHKGDFFEGHPYNLSKMGQVKERCPKCNVKYSLETGFYQGSYYVVYALGVALFVSIWVLKLIFFPEAGPGSLILTIFISLILVSPLLYALSKIIWANLFFKYKKEHTIDPLNTKK